MADEDETDENGEYDFDDLEMERVDDAINTSLNEVALGKYIAFIDKLETITSEMVRR